ncbi:uncharacterized protein BYT42DRAFT_501561 [Radiomyces spectabilis]|uniref:uncharacterized protein n=1 Tax=Radiomyces spectabilis TaxID=64574 RepID=UPI00221F105B|nr:uncharacterized protein BYT42DRAFT_501561 [Radiomyces spectabilis]KAI8371798.1 hypothetical protein BYT42DRAFT_501561 [Radiomyces spectabilis]
MAFTLSIDVVAEAILGYIPKYQSHLKELKEDGYHVVGYCRKSKTKEDGSSRQRLLRTMTDRLKERSLCEHVFVSSRSPASQPMQARDRHCRFDINMLRNASGNTQVCLVVIDFAGLTTNVEDLKIF